MTASLTRGYEESSNMINEIIMLHYSDVVSVRSYPIYIMTFLELVIGDNSPEEFS